MWYEPFIDRVAVPESWLRVAVRIALNKYSTRIQKMSDHELETVRSNFRAKCLSGPISINSADANKQHYDVPPMFFQNILSTQMKYSGSVWEGNSDGLETSDRRAIDLYMSRAGLNDGQTVLDLGAGWGSLCIKVARDFRNSQVTAVTNSTSQKEYITFKSRELGLSNLKVVKSDINDFVTIDKYDRVFSIEMLEHVRNVAAVFNRVAEWLNSGGLMFIQVFSHRNYPQYFDDTHSSWMARNFFTGGMMPYIGFYEDIMDLLKIKNTWCLSGYNYHRTLECWLDRFKSNKLALMTQLNEKLTRDQANLFHNRYRFFLIWCSELFRFNQGLDWCLMHYLFQKK